MAEKIVPIITEVGKIWGRDAIFLDKVHVIDETTFELVGQFSICLLYTSQSPRDRTRSRMPSSA